MPGMEPATLIRVWVTAWRKMTGETIARPHLEGECLRCLDDRIVAAF